MVDPGTLRESKTAGEYARWKQLHQLCQDRMAFALKKLRLVITNTPPCPISPPERAGPILRDWYQLTVDVVMQRFRPPTPYADQVRGHKALVDALAHALEHTRNNLVPVALPNRTRPLTREEKLEREMQDLRQQLQQTQVQLRDLLPQTERSVPSLMDVDLPRRAHHLTEAILVDPKITKPDRAEAPLDQDQGFQSANTSGHSLVDVSPPAATDRPPQLRRADSWLQRPTPDRAATAPVAPDGPMTSPESVYEQYVPTPLDLLPPAPFPVAVASGPGAVLPSQDVLAAFDFNTLGDDHVAGQTYTSDTPPAADVLLDDHLLDDDDDVAM
jgi:hypothetical protein